MIDTLDSAYQLSCHKENEMKRITALLAIFAIVVASSSAQAAKKPAKKTAKKTVKKTVKVGTKAPKFQIKDSRGKIIDLAKLTAKGPVLVRLTCGCSGCDKELAYFQTLHKAYKGKGLTSLAIFREPDKKVEKYVKRKKLNMLYAIDSKGTSWGIFQTKTMPSNFLIEKGGKIRAIAAGCDPSGLIAKALAKKVASLLKTSAVDVQKVTNNKNKTAKVKK